MRVGQWVRVGLMVFSLIAVLWVMHYMRSRQMPDGFPTLAAPTGTFSLCPSRVAWLEVNGLRIEETSTKWFRHPIGSDKAEELDPIAVEKWLSAFCSALTREISTATGDGVFVPYVQIGYVAGDPQSLLHSQQGDTYVLQGHHFVSKDLNEALKTLNTLPLAKPPGTS